jgi:iron only hydrogenase large subunit-like protein
MEVFVMNIKVRAKVKIYYGTYYYEGDSLVISYSYKMKGFKKKFGMVSLENKSQYENYDEFMERVAKRLETLSVKEVVDLTEKRVAKEAKKEVEHFSNRDKVDALLKDFNNIKFNFKLK